MSGAPPSPWRGVRRLLAVRLDHLGDLLMTTPALAALRESLPGVHLTLLTSHAAAAAGPHLSMLDEVWPVQVPWMPAGSSMSAPDDAALLARLVAGRFDGAVIFTVCTQSALPAALMCRMAGIGLRLAHSRENPYGLLTDWVRERDFVVSGQLGADPRRQARHEVRRQLALVQAIGCRTHDERLRFDVRPADTASAAERLAQAGIGPGQAYAVLHPGASAASRRWPATRFGEVAQALAAQGLAVAFSGGHAEQALVEAALRAVRPLPGGPPIVSLAAPLSLGELAAAIAGAQVLVANNSGPTHLAAAVGTPVVALYALTNPQHTPWRVAARVMSHDVPCRWCLQSVCPQGHHACLKEVAVAPVVQAALQVGRPVEQEAA